MRTIFVSIPIAYIVALIVGMIATGLLLEFGSSRNLPGEGVTAIWLLPMGLLLAPPVIATILIFRKLRMNDRFLFSMTGAIYLAGPMLLGPLFWPSYYLKPTPKELLVTLTTSPATYLLVFCGVLAGLAGHYVFGSLQSRQKRNQPDYLQVGADLK